MNRDRLRKILLAALLVIALAAFGYFALARRQPTHETAMHPGTMSAAVPEAADHGAAQDNAIFVPPEKQQLIGMRSVPAEMKTLAKDIRIVGKVSYDETRVTRIHAKVSGYIEDVFADSVGKPVHTGDPLFTMYSPDLVATEQDYLLALRSRELLRTSSVASAAMGSENLVAATRERLRLWDVTERDLESLEKDRKVKRAIAVYSPVTGVIMERSAYPHGTFVDPSKDLFTIVDLSRIWVIGEVYETDLPSIRTGQSAIIELPYSNAGRKLRGRIDFIYPFLDPKSRTVQIRMEFPNPDLTLKPDMFTNINISVSLGRQVVVPRDAVMDTGTEQYVFIDKGDGYIQPRRVKTNGETGDETGIEQGLSAGERVVTGANFVVDSEARLKGAFANMGTPSQPKASEKAGTTQAISVDVLEPKTAKTGMNAVRLLVKDSTGKPITGGQVDLKLFMPQMGAMPPMTSNAVLTEAGSGVYSGQIEFLMAWTWQATVTVRKGGNVIGVAQTNITAR